MTRILYNKLVRDRIPEIIKAQDKPYQISVLNNEAYQQALTEKLVEEVQEVVAATGLSTAELKKEIADLWEVLDTLVAAYGLDRQEVLQIQHQRRQERGGFGSRLQLDWVDEPE